jgi:hypothetical protein
MGFLWGCRGLGGGEGGTEDREGLFAVYDADRDWHVGGLNGIFGVWFWKKEMQDCGVEVR